MGPKGERSRGRRFPTSQRRHRKDEAIMSTLTYSHDSVATPAAEAAGKGQRRPFWRRAVDAVIASQQRRAEREIATYLASHGGLFTDDTEREIMQRLSGGRRSV